MTEDEFLSRMKKDDKLNPVITVVFYYGEKIWDGSRCLHDMFEKTRMKRLQYRDWKASLVDYV